MHKTLGIAVGLMLVAGVAVGCDSKFATNSLTGNVAQVSGAKQTKDSEHTAEMTGAKPGEVRGFENEDGTQAYVLQTDGKTTPRQFSQHVLDKEAGTDSAPNSAAPTPTAARVDEDAAPAADGSRRRRPGRTKRSSPKQETAKPTVAAPPLGSKKALGYTPPTTGGLDID